MDGWGRKMKNALEYITISIYIFIILYLADKMVEWGFMIKNLNYTIIVLPILIIGVVSLRFMFLKFNKR